jgi:hypothetical protein
METRPEGLGTGEPSSNNEERRRRLCLRRKKEEEREEAMADASRGCLEKLQRLL